MIFCVEATFLACNLYVLVVFCMQMSRSELSVLRQQISRSFSALGRLLSQFLHLGDMVPGCLYRLRRKCGKPNCRCAQGELHETWALTRSEKGKGRLYSVRAEERPILRDQTLEYRRYQRARAKWVKQSAALLAQIDQLAEKRIVPWPPDQGQNQTSDGSVDHRAPPAESP